MEINSLKLVKNNELLDFVYPIGSVYISLNNTDPSTLFGGEWSQLKDRFLLGVGDTYKTVNKTGGESTHQLTISEIPSHDHEILPVGRKLYWDSGLTGMLTSNNWGSEIQVSTNNTYTRKVGGDTAHNNMPPYLTVYMWSRIS